MSTSPLRRSFILTSLALIAAGRTAHASGANSLELFGIPLKNASRQQLRQAFKSNGLAAIREDNRFWFDKYKADAVLEGASELSVGYVDATSSFASAEYTFPAFMDTQLVAKVIMMVSSKYGRPSSQSGSISLGPVLADWQMTQGMKIEVSRGWPDTTTFLKFIDTAAVKKMNQEIAAEQNAQENHKAKSQSKAF